MPVSFKVITELDPVNSPVVNFPVLALLAPIVPLNAPLLKVPPVTVLPVSVKALGSEKVGFPLTPDPFVTVISFAVPVMVRASAVPDPVLARKPFEATPAMAVRSESNA